MLAAAPVRLNPACSAPALKWRPRSETRLGRGFRPQGFEDMAKPALYIGNKNYSSWSIRAWLALRWAGIEFDEIVIPLGMTGYGKSAIPEILQASPSGRVPVVHVGEARIYDSMAICEWAHEQAPAAGLWPADATKRALARATAAEMHAGFAALRRDLPMNIRRRLDASPALGADTNSDIARVIELWTTLRAEHASAGVFLFGARSIADAMFAPVATRFRTYAIALPEAASAYCEAIFADPDFRTWETDANAEPWAITQAEDLYA